MLRILNKLGRANQLLIKEEVTSQVENSNQIDNYNHKIAINSNNENVTWQLDATIIHPVTVEFQSNIEINSPQEVIKSLIKGLLLGMEIN
jgi:hypothetical protein